MQKLDRETAAALVGLRLLLEAVARVRPDGAELLASLASGTLRVLLDEREGILTVGVTGTPGEPVTWLETVSCDPLDEATFGQLASQIAAGEIPH